MCIFFPLELRQSHFKVKAAWTNIYTNIDVGGWNIKCSTWSPFQMDGREWGWDLFMQRAFYLLGSDLPSHSLSLSLFLFYLALPPSLSLPTSSLFVLNTRGYEEIQRQVWQTYFLLKKFYYENCNITFYISKVYFLNKQISYLLSVTISKVI